MPTCFFVQINVQLHEKYLLRDLLLGYVINLHFYW
jgi:hypothetical protein